MLLIDSGQIKIATRGSTGREVLLAIRGPGEIVGEIAALDGNEHSATVTAMGEVRAYALTPAEFLDFLHRHPRLSVGLLLLMIRRLREADRQRLEYGVLPVTGRIASRLLHLAERYGEPAADGGVRIALRLTRAELADSVPASPKAVALGLRELYAASVLDSDARHHFVIRDLDALRALASGVTRLT
ncbi:Transcriptional regulator [Carbonactinospora thermoautotrophica]|uniref:Transcriptional regulator n=1 Tax=Carbonactinospora thermoautotrophica TaxID=1469144 RepID=A0A132MLT9_9ACTN|nr:Transcriptional regulator [Carbonactinospora thermoautotrophica]